MFTHNLRAMTAFAAGLFCIPTLAYGAPAELAQTGSLVIFPNVEVKWDSVGHVTQDTVLQLANSYPDSVFVQMYFVNGDPPLAPVYAGGQLIERRHPGWNHSGCGITLDWYESNYWSARTGQPGACAFAVLDLGNPPGRPDPENPGGRMLRGFIYAWAVDEFGREINWNYLSGSALIVDYQNVAGWEYPAQAFQAVSGSHGQVLPEPGTLRLDGNEYNRPPDFLLLNFWASGAIPLPGGGAVIQSDTDLTLMPVSQDLRQESPGPITTKAKFDITNMHGDQFSGTTRCITCWDQTLLSAYGLPNHFLLGNLQTETGSARIDGIASASVCGLDSENAALIGVAARILRFGVLQAGGDWNRNGALDLADYQALQSCLDASGAGGAMPPSDCRVVFDLDGDADVDFKDFFDFVLAYGRTNQSYLPITLANQGVEPAIIRYDISFPPGP